MNSKSRFYYYNAFKMMTVWHRPIDADIVPLARFQVQLIISNVTSFFLKTINSKLDSGKLLCSGFYLVRRMLKFLSIPNRAIRRSHFSVHFLAKIKFFTPLNWKFCLFIQSIRNWSKSNCGKSPPNYFHFRSSNRSSENRNIELSMALQGKNWRKLFLSF